MLKRSLQLLKGSRLSSACCSAVTPSLLPQQQPLQLMAVASLSEPELGIFSFFYPLASCQCLRLAKPNRKVVDKGTWETRLTASVLRIEHSV